MRANERAAAAAGIDVGRTKLGAFAVSSFLAGLAGVLMAESTTTLSPTSFLVIGALVALALTYLGGVSSIGGALVAGVMAQAGLATTLSTDLSGGEVGEYVFAVSGIALILTAILAPEGSPGWLAGLPGPPRPSAAPPVMPQGGSTPWIAVSRLSVSNLTVHHGGLVALHDVSIAVGPGRIAGLIGPNGAGKTTFIDTVSGFTTPTSGRIQLDGDARWTDVRPTSDPAVGWSARSSHSSSSTISPSARTCRSRPARPDAGTSSETSSGRAARRPTPWTRSWNSWD